MGAGARAAYETTLFETPVHYPTDSTLLELECWCWRGSSKRRLSWWPNCGARCQVLSSNLWVGSSTELEDLRIR